MIYLSKAEDVSKAFSELGSTAAELHSAIVKEYLVDIRLESKNPSMNTDFQTQILEANLDVVEKCLNLRFTDSKHGGLIKFYYDEYQDGSQSATHSKFYFFSKDKSASMTITIHFV
mgnify:FL=1